MSRNHFARCHRFVLAGVLAAAPLSADVRISEIMYHPQHAEMEAEPLGEEFIEIRNLGTVSVDLTGAEITAGVTFGFPAIAVAAGEALVISSDPAAFAAAHPSVPGAAILGPWTGRLANSGETIQIRDAAGVTIDAVDYADEGDWATRVRGPLDRTHRGWAWESQADGSGSSLELINPALSNNNGRNWAASTVAGGTPAAVNSVDSTDVPPIIAKPAHDPPIPRSSDDVTISCEVVDEVAGAVATLHYRLDGAPAFTAVAMVADPDGVHSATVPAQADRTIVEFYIEAEDASLQTRTWPAPARQTDGSFAQTTNALYQVDNSFDPFTPLDPGGQPVMRIVLTDAEHDELDDIGNTSSEDESNAEMNVTFISRSAEGIRVRYLASVRNRGASSRSNVPNNQLVKFRSDGRWDGLESIKFNADQPTSQVLGSVLFRRFGIETADAVPVQLRINGNNDADQDQNGEMYGSYAMVESFDSDYTANHWPDDPGGNLYQIRDDEVTGEEGELQYEGSDQDEYRNTYFKQSNSSADDFSDLVALTEALNITPAADLFATASQHAHLPQWARMLAVDAMLGNREGGLVTGKGDDFALYSGVTDPRSMLVPHDLDTLGAAGVTESPSYTIFGYAGVDGLAELFDDPEFMVLYYSALVELAEDLYTHDVVDPIIDTMLGSWADSSRISDAKDFIDDRPPGVLAQIPLNFSATTDLSLSGEGYHRTTDGSVSFSGEFDASRTLSLLVNDSPAELDHRSGDWTLNLGSGNAILKPGLNRVIIRAFDGKAGSGSVVNSTELMVWNDSGAATAVAGTLSGEPQTGEPALIVRPDYVPGIPFLVRVELRNEDASVNTDRWDAVAMLSSTRPDITITPDIVTLFNGRGSALVQVAGAGSGGAMTTLVPKSSSWNYLDDGSDQGTAWREPGFDDSGWSIGDAELGYGDGDEATVVSYGTDEDNKFTTTYFRKTFEVADPGAIAGLTLDLLRDDGAVVYLNGTEVASSNMPGGTITSTTFSDGVVGGDDESTYFQFSPDPVHLVAGTNTIAVEIHQTSLTSSDISFNLGLTAEGLSTDAGDFTLVADVGGRQASLDMESLGLPVMTSVSGVLSGTASTWSGVVHVTGDVTVPVGHTLTIDPGTIVLVDGDDIPSSAAGTDIIVEGALHCEGTAAAPVTITASSDGDSWGQIRFYQAQPSWFRHAHIHRAGHAPGGGHTGRGRCFHILGTDVSFEDSSISDNFGKIGETSASGGVNPVLTIQRCHLARSVMGFETFDSGVLIEDSHITEMLGTYREDGVTDDDDALYMHQQGGGQSLVVRDTVVALTDDDGIDTLAGENVLIERVIARDCLDKGVSMLGGSGSLSRCTLADNAIGISIKNDGDATLDHVTIAGNSGIGLQARNKTGSDAPSRYTVTNSIVLGPDAVNTDYAATDITFNYCILGESWPYAGSANNLLDDPLFADPAGSDYHLVAASPAIDAADPSAPTDPDGSRADIGRFVYDPAFDPAVGGGEIVWSPSGGPYHVTGDVTVPAGVDLVILPGTSIHLDEGRSITVAGGIRAVGTETMRIQVNALPGAAFVPDPVGNGLLPDGPPKSAGIRLVDSMSPDNVIAWLDIANAQDSDGAIGIIRSECLIDHVRFSGTHLRMLYTEDASVTVQHCAFADMFAPGESPEALGLDNVSEHIKGIGEPPTGGRYIIRNNNFGTNKGHNDVIDVSGPRLPSPIVQVIGNGFAGTGDELIDLGGDAYIAENNFFNVHKDDETSDRGYANAISTGDAGSGTTIVVARNIFHDVDHAINLKRDTATIFEHNTVYQINPDFTDRFGNPSVASVVNLYIPTDVGPTPGDGAYLSGNILTDLPRVFSGADLPSPRVTPLEFHYNLVDPAIVDITIGDGHPGQTIFDLGDVNGIALPMFLDPDNGDFRLAAGSPAAGAGPFGQDLGALGPGGIRISGEPPALTGETSANLVVGGPGIFAYRWRINGGPWSADSDIGAGFDPPAATVRSAVIALSGLADGTYTVEVEGRSFAGEWQQTPTLSKTWTVDSLLPGFVRINEILATGDPDMVEFFNPGLTDYDLGGCFLSDDPAVPTKMALPAGTSVGAGEHLVVALDPANFQLDADGESLTLSAPDGVTVIDSVSFGHQPAGYTLGRAGHNAAWTLVQPSLGTDNVAAAVGSASAVFICEWLANGEVAYEDDFVELCNPLSLPVDLSGCYLTDNPNAQPLLYQIPPLSFIGPGGVAAFTAGGGLSFRLSATTEQIALLDSSGGSIDSVVYISQTTDVAEVRAADGATGFEHLPTPGVGVPAAGSPEEADYLRAVAIFDNLRITEVMYDPVQGSDYEFVEFRNIGTSTLDLTGLRITDGVQFTFPAYSLAPGEYVLVVRNLSAFVSLYGPGLPVAGEYTGKLDNGGEEITVQLPSPYRAAVMRFSYDDAWFPETDGLGRSLVFADPTLPVSLWSDSSFWAASAEDGGNPAGFSVIATGFPAWLADNGVTGADKDADNDGLEHLLEYALGLDPNLPETLAMEISFDGQNHPVFPLPLADPARADTIITIEATDSPGGLWQAIGTRAGQAPWVGPAVITGGASVTVTDPTTTYPADATKFYRVRVELAP